MEDPGRIVIPNEEEADYPCVECGCEADYVVNGQNYCKECAKDTFQHYFGRGECSNCFALIEDEYYTVDGEILCPDCFDEIFRM